MCVNFRITPPLAITLYICRQKHFINMYTRIRTYSIAECPVFAPGDASQTTPEAFGGILVKVFDNQYVKLCFITYSKQSVVHITKSSKFHFVLQTKRFKH